MEVSDEEKLMDKASRSRSETESLPGKDEPTFDEKKLVQHTPSSESLGAGSSSATSNKSFSKSIKALVAYQSD